MIRAKMSSADAKKAKRRKARKTAKTNSGTSLNTISFESLPSPKPASSVKNLPEDLRQVLEQVEEIPMPPTVPNGIIPNLNLGPLPAVPNFSMTLPTSPAPAPYLGRDTCLLCHRERPDPPGHSKCTDTKSDCEENHNQGNPLPLWVCPDCRKTVEEEERRATADPNLLEQELRLDSTPTLPIFPDLTGADSSTAAQCNCEACIERRQIEAEHVKETQELQQCWMELRHVVRCVYREAGTGFADNKQLEEGKKPDDDQLSLTSTLPDVNKMKELVHRLCTRDAHQLYQRLESQGREYVIEMKVRLLKQLTCGHKTPPQAKQFVSMLLEEYSNLCCAAKTLATFLTELEAEHLKRFNLTWELHNKHLFQSIIYSDPVVQNSLPMLITQLRLGAASKEAYHEDTYPNILHRYLKFDDEMSVISVVWRDCQQLLDNYNDEQAALKAKQKMLKEDWEFFKAQRKLLEQQVMKNKDVPISQASHLSFEAQFTETMRHILTGTKPTSCPNCNRKRCPCDECTISHMITCGIISPEVTEQLPSHHHNSGIYPNDPSRYIIDVTPPSMSSTSSSSGSSSPIAIDPERLVLPFDDCPDNFDVGEDEIPEEIEGASDSSSEKNEAMAVKEDADASCQNIVDREGNEEKKAEETNTATSNDNDPDERSSEEGVKTAADGINEDDEDDDDDDDDDDGDDGTDGEFGDDEEEDDDDDDIDESDDDVYASGEDDEENLTTTRLDLESNKEEMNSAMAAALRQASLLPELAGPSEGCDCTHCTQAKHNQLLSQANNTFEDESSVSQCQCHACLQQAGKNITTSLPQQVSTTPRPAALHLYPHIHGANNIAGLHAATAGHNNHIHPSLQPHLYELHSPLHATSNTSTAANAGSNKSDQPKTSASQHTNLNLDIDSHEALHEHIYHAYGDWDNSYDTTKLMLAGHKFSAGLGSELFGAPPPLMTGNPFAPDVIGASCTGTLDGSSTSSQVTSTKILQFGLGTTACSLGISSGTGSNNTTSAGNGISSACSAAATFTGSAVPSSEVVTSLLNSSVANHYSAKSDHVHTDACFKNMKTLPASSTGSRMLFNPNQSVNQGIKSGSFLSPSAGSSLSVSSTQSSAFSTSSLGVAGINSGASIASLATGVSLPLSEHCLKHNPFLHTHHSSFSGTHTTTTISTSSGLPAHPPPMKLTSELMRSVAMKEGVSTSQKSVTSQPISNQPLPPPPATVSTPHTCTHMHGTTGGVQGITQPAGQHNLHAGLLDPNSQAHNQSLSAAMANAFNSGAAGMASAYNNVSVGTSTGCEAGCDGHHDDQYDSVDDSCSEQSSSTSASNQKDGKYCDCCYCEFFGHSNPPQAPTSRNYPEMRDRLRLRLKKKNEHKNERYEKMTPKPSLRKEDMVDRRGLDELIKFINGAEENMGMGGATHIERNDKASGKIAKRQRQKQRKFEEKMRKDREEMERKAREEAERKRAREAAAHQQKLQQQLLQQQQQRRQQQQQQAEQAGKNRKKKSKHKEDCQMEQAKESGPKSSPLNTKTETVKNNNNKTNNIQETCVDSNNKKNLKHKPVSPNDGKQKVRMSQSNATAKLNPSSFQTNNNANSRVPGETTKRNSSKLQQLQQPKHDLLRGSNSSQRQVETRRKPDGATTKQEETKQNTVSVCKTSKKPKQAVQQTSVPSNGKNTKSQEQPHQPVVNPLTSQQPRKSVPATALHQDSKQNGGSGGGSKLGLNLALQATARALERKRDFLQKQKQQAEQQESQEGKLPLTQQESAQIPKNKIVGKTKKTITTQQQQQYQAPVTPTKQQRQQQMVNNVMNLHQQNPAGTGRSAPDGMKLPVQKPATPPQCVDTQKVTHENHLNAKPRSNQQMNGSLPQQQQQQQHVYKMMNGAVTPTTPRTPEKKPTTREPTDLQREQATTPLKEPSNKDDKPQRNDNETSGSASKIKKGRRRGKGVDDVEEIFKPKEDIDSDTGEMDDFERELEEFKRFCWDSAPQPKKEKVKVNVNLKDIFNKKGKQGISCS